MTWLLPSVRRGLRQAFLLAALMVSALACYLLVLNWRGRAAKVATLTYWDEQIPFSPCWVWVYLLPYLVGPAVAASLRSTTFTWFIRRGLLALAISLGIFLAYPTHTVRPPVAELGDGVSARLYQRMVAIDDPPANAAPSLHVSLTCLLAWAMARDFPRWSAVCLAAAALVWLATLLTWQHHLIDVATGLLLAGVLAWPWRGSSRT
jgi:membrane-associated phospholipid phosphatase